MGDMDQIYGALSIIVLGFGIYSLYAYFKMKKDGHINETLLLGKSYTEQMCKDKNAFVKKALPAVLVLGIAALIYGIVAFVHYYVTPLGIAEIAGMILFLIILYWFGFYTVKLKKQYF